MTRQKPDGEAANDRAGAGQSRAGCFKNRKSLSFELFFFSAKLRRIVFDIQCSGLLCRTGPMSLF
jgi:hypothetical protein